MSRNLSPVPVSLGDPGAFVDELELAIAGEQSILPLPAEDRAKAELLRTTLLAGKPIDPGVAVVVPTSGSTGTPKGAMLTARNLVASADATHQALGGPGQWLLAMPAHHIAGLQVLTRALVAGVEPYCLDLTAGFSVPAFARGAEELAQTGDRVYTALTAMQLAKAMDTLEGIDALRVFDTILVGGGAVNPQLLESALKLDINPVTTYGCSETAGGCVYDGRPLPGTEIRVEADGRILLGGPTVARGYRNPGPNVDITAFSGTWFKTTDAGFLDGDVLTVTGRLDNIINSGGLKLHPEAIEQLLLHIKGVDSACVVGVPHPRLGQMIAAAYTGWASRADILEALDDLPRWQVPKDLRRVAELPTTGPGKPDRQAVAQLFS
ncbi:O-succinylbenzoic acid--CoA ligase [Corynebacterium phocae]|uniref:O-succinylbenzoic acid--CoA ligase n=1 Tax=Corynebacterium phocae TaxID=161895 RepID=A0A1L7D119_9CORY|nr:o-succinylbenzoate--CoA ligase [Corynebacterium phocae]APT91846.1 O-succinylbenzoic acid--CoA ligase [Corynebacterium phocae]KAA8727456.1 o-succinylbenzoate--CoA ligase [Corynebacterium phocae]